MYLQHQQEQHSYHPVSPPTRTAVGGPSLLVGMRWEESEEEEGEEEPVWLSGCDEEEEAQEEEQEQEQEEEHIQTDLLIRSDRKTTGYTRG